MTNRAKPHSAIVHALFLMNTMQRDYNLNVDNANRYRSILHEMRMYILEHEDVKCINRCTYESFVDEQNIDNLHIIIWKIRNPGKQAQEEIPVYTLKDASDIELIKLVIMILEAISWNQSGELLLMKYNPCIYNVGWTTLSKQCRGKIITMDGEIVTHAFDKFYNFNEVAETKEDVVRAALAKSDYVYACEKKDGSLIAISRHKDKILITTNGSFENEQTAVAKSILRKKYQKFLQEMKEDYTYIFEIIYPENRIVVDYGDERDLYMLSVRSLCTGKLLSLDEIKNVANDFGFKMPKIYHFETLDEYLELAKNLTQANQEGWVFRIGYDGSELMVKLKLEEYFTLHRMNDEAVSLWLIYRLLIQNQLDDFISQCTDVQRKHVNEKLDQIRVIREEIAERAQKDAEAFCEANGITIKDFDPRKHITLLKKAKCKYHHYSLRYLTNMERMKEDINRMLLPAFKNTVREYHPEWCPSPPEEQQEGSA